MQHLYHAHLHFPPYSRERVHQARAPIPKKTTALPTWPKIYNSSVQTLSTGKKQTALLTLIHRGVNSPYTKDSIYYKLRTSRYQCFHRVFHSMFSSTAADRGSHYLAIFLTLKASSIVLFLKPPSPSMMSTGDSFTKWRTGTKLSTGMYYWRISCAHIIHDRSDPQWKEQVLISKDWPPTAHHGISTFSGSTLTPKK